MSGEGSKVAVGLAGLALGFGLVGLVGFIQPTPSEVIRPAGAGPQRVWLTWPSADTNVYAVQTRTNLAAGEWQVLLVVSNPLVGVLVEATNERSFYRLEVKQ